MGKVVATIVTATLDKKKGRRTCELACRTAGVPCEIIVAYDKVVRGVTKNANAGFRRALETEAQYIVYIVDDARCVQKDWLERMIGVLESNPKYGIAAPSGRCRGTQSRGVPSMPPRAQVVSNLSFFCVVIKRELMEQIGLFDEGYIHYGQDNDYCNRAKKAGWKCLWIQDVYVHHQPSSIIRKWKRADQARYRKKWG